MCIRDRVLIEQFLNSMEMDLQKIDYNSALYDKYIFGSAEVVGLMCLQVFTEGNKEKFQELNPVSYTHLDVYKRQTYCLGKNIISNQKENQS